MAKIALKKALEWTSLNKQGLAEVLFPGLKNPYRKLWRANKNKLVLLNPASVGRLAAYIGVPEELIQGNQEHEIDRRIGDPGIRIETENWIAFVDNNLKASRVLSKRGPDVQFFSHPTRISFAELIREFNTISNGDR